jgi:hypothetical protein
MKQQSSGQVDSSKAGELLSTGMTKSGGRGGSAGQPGRQACWVAFLCVSGRSQQL